MEQNGLDREGSGADNQEVLETLRGEAMRTWASEMSRRVQNRGADTCSGGGYTDGGIAGDKEELQGRRGMKGYGWRRG